MSGDESPYVKDQAYLDHVFEVIQRRIDDLHLIVSEPGFSRRPNAGFLLTELAALENPEPPFFGRLEFDDGATLYVGRMLLFDYDGEPLVINWEADAAIPYYTASVSDPMGLRSKSHFEIEAGSIVSVNTENFSRDSLERASASAIYDEALVDWSERAAGSRMASIVDRIRREQYDAIDRPDDRALLVVGGPGTGKTAVGLHRLARIMHRNARKRASPLVIGPNPGFIQFIQNVLPGLAHTASYATAASLYSAVEGSFEDSLDLQRLKGDPRMAALLAKAVESLPRRPDSQLVIRLALANVVIGADELTALFDEARVPSLPYVDQRRSFRTSLRRMVDERYAVRIARSGSTGRSSAEISSDLARATELGRFVASTWPSASAHSLLRDLLGRRRQLELLSDGILRPDEVDLLFRPPQAKMELERWSYSDMALLSEAEWLLTGGPPSNSHVIVDEVQDLSPMELRAVGRRVADGSVTLLGDLAQGTGEWSYVDWVEPLEHAQAWHDHDLVRMDIGYRVPGNIMDVAARVLEVAAPNLSIPQSLIPGFDMPSFVEVEAATLVKSAVETVGELSSMSKDRRETTAIVAPASLVEPIALACEAARIAVSRFERAGVGEQVTVLRGIDSKGLEFDNVVLVEPAVLMQERTAGMRVLYVAITRAMKRLRIVHAEPLPSFLEDWNRSKPRLERLDHEAISNDLSVHSMLVADDIQAYISDAAASLSLPDLITIYHLVRRLGGRLDSDP